MIKAIILPVLLSLMLIGCAVIDKMSFARFVAMDIVERMIMNNPERAMEIYDIATVAVTMLNNGDPLTLVQKKVDDKLATAKLTMTERQFLEEKITEIKDSLFNQGLNESQIRTKAIGIAEWAQRTAEIYGGKK